MAGFFVYAANLFGLILFPGSTTSLEANQILLLETFSYLPLIAQKRNSKRTPLAFSNFKLHMMHEISISMEIMIYLVNEAIKVDSKLDCYSCNKKVFYFVIKSSVSRKFGNIKSNLVCHSIRGGGEVQLDPIVSE